MGWRLKLGCAGGKSQGVLVARTQPEGSVQLRTHLLVGPGRELEGTAALVPGTSTLKTPSNTQLNLPTPLLSPQGNLLLLSCISQQDHCPKCIALLQPQEEQHSSGSKMP